MINPKKLLYLDCETTGTNAVENDIIQVAGIIEIEGKLREDFNFFVQPVNWGSISQKALDSNHWTIEGLKKIPHLGKEILTNLTKVLGKYVNVYDKSDPKFLVVGHNARFDIDFLDNFFKKHKVGTYPCVASYMDMRGVDTMSLGAVLYLVDYLSLENLKLATIAKAFEVPLENAHDALHDAYAARGIYKKFMELLKLAVNSKRKVGELCQTSA